MLNHWEEHPISCCYKMTQQAFVMSHSKDQTAEFVKSFIRLLEKQTGNSVKIFKSDGGAEFSSNHMKSYFDSRGIIHETSTAYCAQQNGKIERSMRTIKDCARAMLQNYNSPEF